MKTSATKTMLLVMIAIVSVLMVAQIAKAAVKGSKHDLSSSGPNNGTFTTNNTEVCIFCHTPHFSGTDVPLWNRKSDGNTKTTFLMYTSDTLRKPTASTPQGVSAACLSCHDGATALESLKNLPGSGTTTVDGYTASTVKMSAITGSNGLILDGSNDLRNDHPISIEYVPANGLKPHATFGKGNKVGDLLPLYGSAYNQVECASCHNVHDNTTAPPFLRASNSASALCLTCHNK